MKYPPYTYARSDIEKMIDLLENRGFFFDIEFKNRAILTVSHYCDNLIDLLKENSSISSIIPDGSLEFELNVVFLNGDMSEKFPNLREVAIFHYNEFLRNKKS